MRQKYWIKVWNSVINNGDYVTLGENYELYQSSNFFEFLWNLLKAYRTHKYINIDIMINPK